MARLGQRGQSGGPRAATQHQNQAVTPPVSGGTSRSSVATRGGRGRGRGRGRGLKRPTTSRIQPEVEEEISPAERSIQVSIGHGLEVTRARVGLYLTCSDCTLTCIGGAKGRVLANGLCCLTSRKLQTQVCLLRLTETLLTVFRRKNRA